MQKNVLLLLDSLFHYFHFEKRKPWDYLNMNNNLNDTLDEGDDVSVEMDDVHSTTDESASSPSPSADTKTASQPTLAQEETKAVGYSRLLVVFVLICVATVAAVATFRYTTDQEEEDFETRVR